MRLGHLAPLLVLAACDGRVYHNLVGPAADELRIAITVTPTEATDVTIASPRRGESGSDPSASTVRFDRDQPGRARVTRSDEGSVDVIADVSLTDPTSCLVLGTPFTGDLEGRPADHIRRGAVTEDGNCTWPQLGFAIPAVERVDDAQIHLGDRTLDITAELGDRLVPRATALDAPADAIVRPGARLRAAWSSAADRATGAFQISLIAAGVNVADLPATVDGDRVVADVPATFTADGTGLLCVAWSSAWSASDIALGCDDLACRLVADYRACVPVWFAART